MFPFVNSMEKKISDLNLLIFQPAIRSPDSETTQLITVLTKGNH